MAETICEHDNGEPFSNLSGVCKKCGKDLDKEYIFNHLRFLEGRIKKLESEVK